jgi:hypothetical protein
VNKAVSVESLEVLGVESFCFFYLSLSEASAISSSASLLIAVEGGLSLFDLLIINQYSLFTKKLGFDRHVIIEAILIIENAIFALFELWTKTIS